MLSCCMLEVDARNPESSAPRAGSIAVAVQKHELTAADSSEITQGVITGTEIERRIDPYRRELQRLDRRARQCTTAWYATEALVVSVIAATTAAGLLEWGKTAVGLLGVCSLMVTLMRGIAQFREHGIRFRIAAENLRSRLRRLETSEKITHKLIDELQFAMEQALRGELYDWKLLAAQSREVSHSVDTHQDPRQADRSS